MSMKFHKAEAFVNESFNGSKLLGGDIPKAEELSGIELRLSKVLIKDNGTPEIFPFPGLAQMYLLIIVISDLEVPLHKVDLRDFAKVDDNEELPVDRTIFYWKKDSTTTRIPGQIHVFVSIIKSKESLRNAGSILSQVKNDKDYKDLVSGLTDLLKATPVGQVADTIFKLASIVGSYLGNVKDKPLLTWVQSFTDLNADFNFVGKAVKTTENKNASIALTLIVRDKAREVQALQKQPKEIADQLRMEV